MKLTDSKLILDTDWVVHFETMLDNFGDQPMFYVTTKIKELYNDWYNKCELCPSNGNYVYNVALGDDKGHVYLIETNYKFTFEEMMRFFETTLKLKELLEEEEKWFNSLIGELAGLVDIQYNGYALDDEENQRYLEIIDILRDNNIEIPFGIEV